ncbi:MAG: hypothetical protein H0T42_07860 [Deltaproteobacteria bacterium]|nr:hypothetical protein [Deltaproteobacteria bacterium]
MSDVAPFLHGAVTLGCFAVGLKFLKFWKLSRDRFFLWFAAAFWAFAVGWALRAFGPISGDHAYYIYVPRLAAFLLILAAIVDKNRRAAS